MRVGGYTAVSISSHHPLLGIHEMIAETAIKTRLTMWMLLVFTGMAARLSADLGLHLDVSEQTRQGLLDSRDIYIRQTAYQGVFIHEK